MTEQIANKPAALWNRWRVARWLGAAALLLTPLVMMQFIPDWNWTVGSFLVAGTVIAGVLLLYELAERISDRRAYRIGSAIALGTSFLLVWSTLVRDDSQGIGFFLVVMTASVGAFAGRFSADAMARTMLGVATMQALLGLAVATAPIVARVPGASTWYLMYSGVFGLAWLIAAGSFYAAAKAD